ncbi:MAG: ArsR/SmtB family transcription factor [Solirubrobacteraceae bacterium]
MREGPSICSLRADLFWLLGCPMRVRILDLLSDGGERTVGHLRAAPGLESSRTSEHVMTMRTRGLLESRRHGPNVFYSAKDPRVFELLELASEVLQTRDELGASRPSGSPTG